MKSVFMRGFSWLFFLLVAMDPAMAQQAPKPVFTLDFSDGPNAKNALGQKIRARVEGNLVVQNSPHGKAMLSGPSSGYLHFPAQDVVNPRSGTVEMWVSPHDWTSKEQNFHVFFDARGQGVLYLYKYFQGPLLMLAAPKEEGPYSNAAANFDGWEPGKWHHIAGTWSPTKISVYLDGKLMNTVHRPFLPASISGEFRIGDHPWNEDIAARKSQSLVAGVRIYDRTLTPEHIAAHYNGDYDKVVPFSSKLLSLYLAHEVRTHQLNVSLNTGGADFSQATTKVDISLQRNGKVVQQTQAQQIEIDEAQARFATDKLTPGDYQVVVDVAAGTN